MMEDNRVSHKELLVARSDKRHREVCRRVWHVSVNEE